MFKQLSSWMVILYVIVLYSYQDIFSHYIDVYSVQTFKNLNTFELLRTVDFSIFYLIFAIIFKKFGFMLTAILISIFQILYGIVTIFILELNIDEVSSIWVYLLALFYSVSWIGLEINLVLGVDKIFRKSGIFLIAIYYCLLSLARVIYSYKRDDILDWYFGIFDKDSSKQLLVLSFVSLVSVLVAFPIQKYLGQVN